MDLIRTLGRFARIGKTIIRSENITNEAYLLSMEALGMVPAQLSLSSLSPGTNTQSSRPWVPLPLSATRIPPSGELNVTPRVERGGGQGPATAWGLP